MGIYRPAMTATAVAQVALEYIKVGRLQASLAQRRKNTQFQGGCAYQHKELNGFGETCHCVIGAWLDKYGLLKHINPRTDAVTITSQLFDKGLIPFVGVGQRRQLDELQAMHDLACGSDRISRANYKEFKKALKLCAAGHSILPFS